MSMGRKDYERFAALFAGEMALARNAIRAGETASLSACTAVRNIVLSTADIFAQDNPRFDRERFYAASGIGE